MPQACLGFHPSREKACCLLPPPRVLLLQSSIQDCNAPAASNHWFLCCCCGGVKAYDGIWKRINNCCKRPRWQTLASGIDEKQTWVMISEENKAFILGCWEWCHPAGCSFISLFGWVQVHLAREAEHPGKTLCLKTEDNLTLQTHLGGKHQPIHVLGAFIFQFSFGSHTSPPSSLFSLAKRQGPGQEFLEKPGETLGEGVGEFPLCWRQLAVPMALCLSVRSHALANGHHIIQDAFSGIALMAVDNMLKGPTPDLPLIDLAIFAFKCPKEPIILKISN